MSLSWDAFANAVMGAMTSIADAVSRIIYTLYDMFMREMGGERGVYTFVQAITFGVLLNFVLKIFGLDVGKLLTRLFNRLDQYVSRWF